MADTTVVAGIEIPSTSPIFLTIVGLHVLIGSVCVVSGIVAMLSPKRAGRHPTFGSIYFWSLAGFSVRNHFVRHPVEGGLPSFHSGNACLRGGDFRSPSGPPARTRLGKNAHHRHGHVLHPVADRFLCRQRQKPSALARASFNRVLVYTGRRRHTVDRARAVAASSRKALRQREQGRLIRANVAARCGAGRRPTGDGPYFHYSRNIVDSQPKF
jgi:hypothetical protein